MGRTDMTQADIQAAHDTHPLVDRSALDPIMGATGVEVMRRIVDAFWDAADDMMAAIETAVNSGDAVAIQKAAHTMKGAASNIGAGRAAKVAASMETAGPERAPGLLAELRVTMDETRPALNDVLDAAA